MGMTHVRSVRCIPSLLSRGSSLGRYLALGLGVLALSTTLACDSSTSPPEAFLLTVAEPPEGAATIQSQPAGINCPGVCSAEFTEGTGVYLTVSPSPGWDFQGWSGACVGGNDFCGVTMSTPMQVAASFENRLGAPTDLEGWGVTQVDLELTWADNALHETGFAVEQSPDGITGWAQVGTAEETTYLVTDLLPGTTNYFRVRACEGTVCGDFSDVASVSSPPPFSSVAGAFYHTCGITPAGEAYCWGFGPGGRLGTGDSHTRTIPTAVVGGLTFSDISMGRYHTCAVATGGQAYCWGGGAQNGVLGIGEVEEGFNSYTPIPVSGGLSFKSIGSGWKSNCGLTLEGEAFCWGLGSSGQLGTGGVNDQFSPAPVVGGLAFESIAVGQSHVCGLTETGETWCWGSPYANGSTERQTAPVAVVGAPAFASIYAGGHTCGLTAAGEAYCWGNGQNGQLGNGAMDAQVSPVPVAGGMTFQSLSLGGAHTCGLTASGSAYCWGWGGRGALGTGGEADTAIPVPVEGGLAFSFLGSGRYHSCGLTAVGQTFCWGWNLTGQLGGGSQGSNSLLPIPTVWH